MDVHYHKMEFKCRKCGKEQVIEMRCGTIMEEMYDVACELCGARNMWLGTYDGEHREYPGSIPSPISLLEL